MARYQRPDNSKHDCTVCFKAIVTGEEIEDSEGLLYHKDCFVEAAEDSPEACPGCGAMPGDGYTEDCDDEDGCGFYKRQEVEMGKCLECGVNLEDGELHKSDCKVVELNRECFEKSV